MTTTISRYHDQDGAVLCRSVLDRPQLAAWKLRIDARYETLEDARRRGVPATSNGLIPQDQRFVPTASSFPIGAALSDENLRAVFAGINAGPAGVWIRDELGNPIACDLDQAWVRRQYAPRNYPPLHAPHGWHQDGALGFDFLSHRDGTFPSDALLPMVTCWIALGLCGVEAPGLELVRRRLDGLLAPSELADERVRGRFAPEEFWRPVLEPGDGLLFRGDLLHRTHVTAAMTRDRTSIELRFFPGKNCPARLKDDRFITLV